MGDSLIHQVPTAISPQRLQEYGVGLFDPIRTKSALKKALKKHQIKVDDKSGTTATIIKGGETIRFTPFTDKLPHKKLNLKLDVLFEDDYLAAIAKPAGIQVSGNSFKTIANGLAQNLKKSPQLDAVSPKPVHRLDYATTGILLVGKTADSIRRLNKMFQDKEFEKTYYAVTIGYMESYGTLRQSINGKEAISNFETIATLDSPRFEKLNLVKLQPETGRRHQLRIHLADLENPILGDRDYSPTNLLLKGKGMYLHAFSLEFVHPFTGEQLELKAPLPERFTKLFGKL